VVTADDLRRLVLRGRNEETFSVAAYEIGRSTGPLCTDVIGTLSWDGPTATPHTPFDIASVTKPIVALLAVALLEHGELALDDTVERLLPRYAHTDKARITIGELLTHTSGLPGQVRMYRWAHTPEQMWDGLADLQLIAPPGAKVTYSSQGFILLGAILEAAAAMPLDEAVRTHVLSPIGMHNTRFGLPERDRAFAAATEQCLWRGSLVQGTVHDENADVLCAPAGHAGIFSTASDLGRLCQLMLREGSGDSGRVFTESAVRAMTEPRTDHLNLRRCLGWQGRDDSGCPAGDLVGRRSYGHTGFTGTSVWMDPETDLYIVLLSNAVHPRRRQSRSAAFRRRFHNAALATGVTMIQGANHG